MRKLLIRITSEFGKSRSIECEVLGGASIRFRHVLRKLVNDLLLQTVEAQFFVKTIVDSKGALTACKVD